MAQTPYQRLCQKIRVLSFRTNSCFFLNINRKNLAARLQEYFLDSFLVTFAPTPEEVQLLHQHGKQVIYNYAGPGEFRRNPKVWSLVRKAHIDGMLTDYPLECRAVWRKLSKPDKP